MKENRNEHNLKASDSKSLFSESAWHINSFFRKVDRFGQPIPAFNVKGKDKVRTVIGGILTIAIITLTLGYFIAKLQE